MKENFAKKSKTSPYSGDSLTKRNTFINPKRNERMRNAGATASYSCLEEIDAYSKITTILFRNKNGKVYRLITFSE